MFIWVNLTPKGTFHFKLPLTIPIWVIVEILESVIEFFLVANLFANNRLRSVSSTLEMIEDFFQELTNYGSFNLVDVKTPKVDVTIKL